MFCSLEVDIPRDYPETNEVGKSNHMTIRSVVVVVVVVYIYYILNKRLRISVSRSLDEWTELITNKRQTDRQADTFLMWSSALSYVS